MSVFRRKSRILTVMASLLLVLTGALVAGPIGGATAHHAAVTPTTAHGEYFLFKSALDSTFCIDEQPGNTQGRTVILSTCTTADTQRWSLTENSDGTNFIVDSQGMCVDSTGRKLGDGFAVEAFDCNSHAHQRFTYTADGQLQARLGCLAVPLAADGAAVSIASCNSASNSQVFKLAR